MELIQNYGGETLWKAITWKTENEREGSLLQMDVVLIVRMEVAWFVSSGGLWYHFYAFSCLSDAGLRRQVRFLVAS